MLIEPSFLHLHNLFSTVARAADDDDKEIMEEKRMEKWKKKERRAKMTKVRELNAFEFFKCDFVRNGNWCGGRVHEHATPITTNCINGLQ